MSAWMCSDEHLSVLVDAIHLFELNLSPKKEDTFATLHLENEMSLAHRYRDQISSSHEGYTKATPEVRPEDIYKLAQSYEYQSCEHPGWEESAACQMITALSIKHEQLWGCRTVDDAYRRCEALDPPPLWALDPQIINGERVYG